MKNTHTINLLFAFALAVHPIQGVFASAANPLQALEQQPEVAQPNPGTLQPNWMDYYKVDKEMLLKRVEATKKLLARFIEEVENQEDKRKAENLTAQIDSHLQSLINLKEQQPEPPILAWLPQPTYTLNDYLSLSDNIWNQEIDIEFDRAEKDSYQHFQQTLNQTLSNAFALYRTEKQTTVAHFLSGLNIMAIGTRRLYYEEAVALMQNQIKNKTLKLNSLNEERTYVDKNVIIVIDSDSLKQMKEKLQTEYESIHDELLNLEMQSIEAYSENQGIEATQLMNQKLTHALIKEAYARAQLMLLKNVEYLNQLNKSKNPIVDPEIVESTKSYLSSEKVQMKNWEDMLTEEFEKLSHAIIAIHDSDDEGSRTETINESLNILLTSRALIDSLSKELYHIKLVLGMIEMKMVQQEDFSDRLAYYINQFYDWGGDFMDKWFHYSIFEIAEIPITLLNILKAMLIIGIAILISKTICAGLRKVHTKEGKILEPTLYIFERLLHYSIILLGIMFALASLGLTMHNVTILLGALGIGLGFGLQNIVNNFLSGLAILFERNIKVGDYIELDSGHFGIIIEVNVQNSTLHTFDGMDVLVPNSTIVGSKLVNWTKKDPYLCFHVPFEVAHGSDQDRVKKVIVEAALKVPSTISDTPPIPNPDVWLVDFGESSLNFELVVWIDIFATQKSRKAMRADYLSEIEKALNAHSIQIALPQMDLHVKSLPPKGILIQKE